MATIYGTQFNDDGITRPILVGTSIADYINGLAGNDRLYGLGGNDTLVGGTGRDTMYGGKGNDVYYVDNVSDVVVESANSGYDTVYASVTEALSANVERLFLTGTSNINGYGNSLNNAIYGNSGRNYLSGGGGNDYLSGGAQNDTLVGGTGRDTMVGGTGNDVYYVDNVFDVVTESANSGYDTVYASISETLSANVERLFLTGTSNSNGFGNSLSNAMYGNNSRNYLYGYGGNDFLSGKGGNDYLNGGSNNDTMLGGTGSDTLVGSSGNDSLNGYGGTSSEYDTLTGDGPSVTAGADKFILGDSSKAFYTGAGYATITDFDWSEGDKFQVHGSISNYSLNKSFNFGGSSALDTAIYYKGDLIGVAQDTTNVYLSLDFNYV